MPPPQEELAAFYAIPTLSLRRSLFHAATIGHPLFDPSTATKDGVHPARTEHGIRYLYLLAALVNVFLHDTRALLRVKRAVVVPKAKDAEPYERGIPCRPLYAQTPSWAPMAERCYGWGEHLRARAAMSPAPLGLGSSGCARLPIEPHRKHLV